MRKGERGKRTATGRAARGARQDYLELKKILKTLGDEVRLNIVHVLASGGEITVTDLAETLAVSQPLISWHLGALKRVGLAQTRRQGRQVYCSLDLNHYKLCLRMLGKVIDPEAQTDPIGIGASQPAASGVLQSVTARPKARPIV